MGWLPKGDLLDDNDADGSRDRTASVTKLLERVELEASPMPATGRRPTLQRFAPEGLVALAVLFNLWVLRSEWLVVSYPNDSQTHLQMVQVARNMLAHGQLPFDHWYAQLSLGSPFFVQYQSASAVLTGALGLVFGSQQAYSATLYLLLALWPICIYITGRLLGWGKWESGIAALISPLLVSVTGRGFEHSAFDWLGSGLWSELWAMWSLPLALAFSWRYINQRRYLFGAVFFLGATIAFHFLMAYLAGLLLVLMVVVSTKDLWQRLGRAALIGGGALLMTLWVTLPLLADARWTAFNEFQVHTWIDDSYGAPKILHWLVTGQIYDSGRFPIVTILVAAGIVACIMRFRTDPRARLLLGIWTLSMLLYFGRPTLGLVLNRLPGSRDLLFQRFIAGVHLSGLFLAAVGAVSIYEWAAVGYRRFRTDPLAQLRRHRWAGVAGGVLAIVVILAALAPAWTQVRTYDGYNTAWINYQRSVDATQGAEVNALLALAQARGGGRVYAGMPSNWGANFKVGAVQAYIYMENSGVDAVGFTLRGFGLMTDPEAWFDQWNPGDYSVLGIRYLLLPVGKSPPVKATLLTESGPYALWTVDTAGIVQVVDTTSPIAANASDLGSATRGFLASSLPGRAIFPTIAFDGHAAAPSTLDPGVPVHGPAGRVLFIHDDLKNGRASAVIFANRTSVVLLKSSFDPGWTVTVDGVGVTPEMIAPALVGVTVAPGLHHVVFEYHGYGSYPLLFVVGLLTLLGILAVPRVRRRLAERRMTNQL
jgi:hypothetical protein